MNEFYFEAGHRNSVIYYLNDNIYAVTPFEVLKYENLVYWKSVISTITNKVEIKQNEIKELENKLKNPTEEDIRYLRKGMPTLIFSKG